ncbi:glucose/arabinose dehydrogenase [Tepidamorphus gemmatus]|jgi:glucose/arabinose dehydrogenase|uniref:Glucose/arabinose dehydrogenase n=1 Tax=Tepidamorphus gemmatus TaxID=747076 RepID=A0A4R3MJ68_9HYPH|nr:PQQ-dependent sugar dehydrogenase [Tepidamorphus gemmatus]TCT12582.1 glucose/arabinose dehydrogenase [Tepidamorphus gemmatus]
MLRHFVLGGLALGLCGAAAEAQVKVKLEPYVTGVNAPLAMVQPAGDDRKFVIEQFGRVRVIDADGNLLAEPFIDIRAKLPKLWSDFDEKGLLGIAFHPDFANNGKFYLAHSAPIDFQADLAKQFWWSHTNVVEEYTVSKDDPNVADPSTVRRITAIDWPQFNHNGHWIGFGPDGYLYISTGDGGYANDWGIGHNVTEGNGQDNTQLQGKILRIDVDNPSNGKQYGIPADNPFANDMNAAPEIYATGLRNPWRCSFDMEDGRLFCADVQQNSFEEVNIIERGGNYGWRKMEATHCFDYTKPNDHPASCDKTGLIEPILEYNNCTAKPDGCKGISVTGGYVYRGAHEPWKGKYIFGDWSKSFSEMDGQIFVATEGSDGKWTMEVAEIEGLEGDKAPYILAFAQDADGEVYALTSITTGPVGSLDTIYKIVPAE